jgi:hypothetical protein
MGLNRKIKHKPKYRGFFILSTVIGISLATQICAMSDRPHPDEHSKTHREGIEAKEQDLPQPSYSINRILQNELPLNSLVEFLNTLDCATTATDTECRLVNQTYSPKQFDPTKVDGSQTILVIDSGGMQYAAASRYASRIKAYYTLTQEGYTPARPSVKIPRYLQYINATIDNAPFVPAVSLRPLHNAMTDHLNYEPTSDIESGHGGSILRYLLENNPKAEFVIIDTQDIQNVFSDAFCEFYTDAFEQKISMLKDQLSNLLQEQDIEYVHYARGYTLKGIKSSWSKHCGGWMENAALKNILLQLTPIYDVLFNSDAVLGFQAGTPQASSNNHPLDTTNQFKNRVRVGYFSTLESNLDASGEIENTRYLPPNIPYEMQASYRYIDYFINFGIIEKRPFPFNQHPLMDIHPLGFDAYPVSNVTTSWATPAALSAAIYTKNGLYPNNPMSNSLIRQLKAQLSPSGCNDWGLELGGNCKIQDPLKFYKHEVYRLKMLLKKREMIL